MNLDECGFMGNIADQNKLKGLITEGTWTMEEVSYKLWAPLTGLPFLERPYSFFCLLAHLDRRHLPFGTDIPGAYDFPPAGRPRFWDLDPLPFFDLRFMAAEIQSPRHSQLVS